MGTVRKQFQLQICIIKTGCAQDATQVSIDNRDSCTILNHEMHFIALDISLPHIPLTDSSIGMQILS